MAVELFYKQYGESGEPLIILHGLLGASGNWHTLSSNVFSRQFRVFAVDQRNHGRSPHDEQFSYDVMADDLKSFLDRHDLKPAHLLGHSMGGKTAMHFALHHPEYVRRLIVADMPPKKTKPAHRELLQALRSLDLSEFDDRGAIDAALAKEISSRPVRQFLLKNLDYEADSRTYSWAMNLEVIYRNYERVNEAVGDGALTFDGPTCFIRGETSDYIADADEPGIRELFPEAEMVTIPGAGHWLHADKPDAFSKAVMRFLGGETA